MRKRVKRAQLADEIHQLKRENLILRGMIQHIGRLFSACIRETNCEGLVDDGDESQNSGG